MNKIIWHDIIKDEARIDYIFEGREKRISMKYEIINGRIIWREPSVLTQVYNHLGHGCLAGIEREIRNSDRRCDE